MVDLISSNVAPQSKPVLTDRSDNSDKISDVSKRFEAVFLGQVFNQMFSTVETGSFGGGFAEDTWKSLLAQEYAKTVVESGSTGISKSIERAIRSYEAQENK